MNPSPLPNFSALNDTPPARRRLEPAACILVAIDLQEKLVPAIANAAAVTRNAQLLLRLAGILGIPILATTQYAHGLGATVAPVAELLGPIAPIDKIEFNCFAREEFRTTLQSLPGHRTTLLICGIEAHICVLQTALGALGSGYLVHVPADATGSRTEPNCRLGLDRMRDAGCVISSTEIALYELLGQAGTPAFKQMLPYIK